LVQIRGGLGIDLRYHVRRYLCVGLCLHFVGFQDFIQYHLDIVQLFLLCCWIVHCLGHFSIVVILVIVRVGCVYRVTITGINVIIIIDIMGWGVPLLLMYRCNCWVRHFVWPILCSLWYMCCLVCVPPSLLVPVWIPVCLSISRPLLLPGILWGYPGCWGALEVFWTVAKKLVQLIQHLFRG
jgi:hypothetical protein